MKNAPLPELPDVSEALSRIKVRYEPNGILLVSNVLGEIVYKAEAPNAETHPNIYTQRWYGYLTPQEIYDILNYVAIPLSCQYGLQRKVLNDATAVTGPWDDANERLRTDIIPRWIGQGLRYSAFVMSIDAFANISATEYNDATAELDSYQNRLFDSEQDALAWLLSVS